MRQLGLTLFEPARERQRLCLSILQYLLACIACTSSETLDKFPMIPVHVILSSFPCWVDQTCRPPDLSNLVTASSTDKFSMPEICNYELPV